MPYVEPKFTAWSLESLEKLLVGYKPATMEWTEWTFVIEAYTQETRYSEAQRYKCYTDSAEQAVNFMLSHALEILHEKEDNYEFIINCSYENYGPLKTIYEEKLAQKLLEIEALRDAKLVVKRDTELAESNKKRDEEIALLRELQTKYPEVK